MSLALANKIDDSIYNINNTNNHFVYVVLSRSSSVVSKVVYLYTRDEYTHASISVDSNLEALYGFGRRWTRCPFVGSLNRELMYQGLYSLCKTVPGVILKLNVTNNQYQQLKENLDYYIYNKSLYKYNYLGFLGCIFQAEFRSKKRFTCSEFVAHLLQISDVAKFDKPLNLVRPQTLSELGGEIIYKGDLKKFFPDGKAL